jgi:hypothetical protein
LYLVVLFGEELSASIQPGNESVDMIFIDELAHFHPVVPFADTEQCERASAGQSAWTITPASSSRLIRWTKSAVRTSAGNRQSS